MPVGPPRSKAPTGPCLKVSSVILVGAFSWVYFLVGLMTVQTVSPSLGAWRRRGSGQSCLGGRAQGHRLLLLLLIVVDGDGHAEQAGVGIGVQTLIGLDDLVERRGPRHPSWPAWGHRQGPGRPGPAWRPGRSERDGDRGGSRLWFLWNVNGEQQGRGE